MGKRTPQVTVVTLQLPDGRAFTWNLEWWTAEISQPYTFDAAAAELHPVGGEELVLRGRLPAVPARRRLRRQG